ncbi:WD40/YVTN/BNR-like repeat-containing protein [Ferribacterium limneticum]|uniref:WD40/YVTN/BNR-like repeat-containing protein n=1 Tax=Ferribacterium limneticum TaxID=76259 RepID=UPI001CF82220|nr:YCF48-related protein [Ferribacterium limneticum]
MSGIAAERERSVHRYDISQAMAANGKVIVVGTQSGVVLTSEDQGKSWKRTPLGDTSLVDMTVCGDQGFVAIDHYHKVWSADAEGKNWKSLPLEMPRTPLAVTCDKQGGWWVVGVNSVIAGSADQGKTWKTTDLGEDTQITTIQFLDEKNGIALGEFGLTVMTDDGGATWKKGPKMPGEFYAYAALFSSRSEGWVSGLAGQVLHTTDGGKSWVKQANTTQATLNRLFMHEGQPFGVGAGGVIARLEGDSWRAVPYTDPVPVFLGGGASLPGQSAIVIGGPGGLLRAVSTHAKQ